MGGGPAVSKCQPGWGVRSSRFDHIFGNYWGVRSSRFDHIFGNYLTHGGKVRRMDVIIAPPAERAACILGWTGSRQYLRFLRQYAADRGLHLNSHRHATLSTCICEALPLLCTEVSAGFH